MRAARGVVLDAEAARVLYGLAVRGLAAQRERDGGGIVSAGTAEVLRSLAAAARDEDQDAAGFVAGAVAGSAVEAVAAVRAASCPREVFTTAEAAAAWGCTPSYVRRLCRQGEVAGAVRTEDDSWMIPAAVVHAGLPRRR